MGPTLLLPAQPSIQQQSTSATSARGRLSSSPAGWRRREHPQLPSLPMDFELPGPDDPRRLAVREWIAANPEPTGKQLAEAGYVVPHWPRPWGLEADPITQVIIDDELQKAGTRRP